MSELSRIRIGYRSPKLLLFGYGLDMEFMKKFRIGSGLPTFHIRTSLTCTAVMLTLRRHS